LSNDYFTNRQDRYHVFSSKDITSYFWKIQSAVGKLSFVVVPDEKIEAGYTLQWPESNAAPSPLEDPAGYVSKATKLMAPMIKAIPKTTIEGSDTAVYPLSQLTQLLIPDTSTEKPAVTAVLAALSSSAFANSSWTFTAGYFNPDPILTKLLIDSKSSRGTVITASPWANGFHGAKGPAGLLPPAYTLLARRFLESAQRAGRGPAITLKEWRKGTVGEPGGWTYHAKGLWVSLPNESVPSITLIGSSNYTKRSYSLDLEANALIVTKNEALKARLGEEEAWLQEHTKVVTSDDFATTERRVGLQVRIAMWLVSISGGAL
jgi:CDP-diacylglycerol--glycerol-3-phosphate 3-phosphatidyltransferase